MSFKIVIKPNTYYLTDIPTLKVYLPHGNTNYDKLWEEHTLDKFQSIIAIELSNIRNSLHKYERGYDKEDHKEMCNEMRKLLTYLESHLDLVNKIKREVK